jgi:hypothetical protein
LALRVPFPVRLGSYLGLLAAAIIGGMDKTQDCLELIANELMALLIVAVRHTGTRVPFGIAEDIDAARVRLGLISLGHGALGGKD